MIPVGGARSHYFVVKADGARAYVADTMSGMVIMVDPDDASFAPVKQHIGKAPEGWRSAPTSARSMSSIARLGFSTRSTR